jgi:alanine racemase
MDWTMIDVTEIPNAALGDQVTIMGRENSMSITAADLAAVADTISYEITCGFSNRVPRTFVGERTV